MSKNKEKYTILDVLRDYILKKVEYNGLGVYISRLSVCVNCNKLKGKEPFEKCTECGCFMRLKCAYKKSKCDLNKW